MPSSLPDVCRTFSIHGDALGSNLCDCPLDIASKIDCMQRLHLFLMYAEPATVHGDGPVQLLSGHHQRPAVRAGSRLT